GQIVSLKQPARKLKDNCPRFDNPVQPKEMVWTGGTPAQRFRNQIRNCTWDTGRGNPGAIGIRVDASNVGCLRDVDIRSGDGAGVIGLDMSYADDFGPCFVKNVRISHGGKQHGHWTFWSL